MFDRHLFQSYCSPIRTSTGAASSYSHPKFQSYCSPIRTMSSKRDGYPVTCFNPTVVQLELDPGLAAHRSHKLCFNPTVVQLEREELPEGHRRPGQFQSYCSPIRTQRADSRPMIPVPVSILL